MNRRNALSLALFLGLALLTTLSFGQDGAQATVLHAVPASTNCPIDMQAQLGSSGEVQRVNPIGPKETGQRLYLHLKNLKSVRIAGAEITVHGFTTEGRVLEAQAAKAGSSITKNIVLAISVGGGQDASVNIWLRGLGSVNLVDLASVTYADGSMWRSSAGETCHAAPGALRISLRQ